MGIAPGDTTIRKCGTQHSGTNLKTRTSILFKCSNFQTNYRKSPQGNQKRFTEDVNGSHRKLINKHLEKSRNVKMVHLYMRRKGLQSTKETPPDKELE